MLLSAVSRFKDALAYEAARGARGEILVTEKGDFCAELTQIDLPRLQIRRGRENLARISRIRVPPGRGMLYFMFEPSRRAVHIGGRVLTAGDIVVLAPNTAEHDCTTAPCRWNSVSFSTADLTDAAQAVVGRELALASVTYLVRPDPEHRTRMRSVLDYAVRLAGATPEAFACPDVVRELEQELIHAMIKCLNDGTPVAESRAASDHSRVMERFEAVAAANRGRPMYLAEICAAIGVSERTLRVCCHNHLGMGPIQYLRLWRMHLARHALLLAEPNKSTVTEIATNFGFCELGRFSVEYRALYGESPSSSLHRLPEEPRRGRRVWAAVEDHARNSVAG